MMVQLNSLAPGRYVGNFTITVSQHMFQIEFHRNYNIDWHANKFHYCYETYDYVFIENIEFVKLVFMIPTIIAQILMDVLHLWVKS